MNKFSFFKKNNKFVYIQKIKKLFIIKYIKNIVKQLALKRVQQIVKKQKYEVSLLTKGSKALEEFTEIYKVKKLHEKAINFMFSEAQNPDQIKVSGFFYFILNSFVKLTLARFSLKFSIQLFFKLAQLNFNFFIYKKILSKTNDTRLKNFFRIFNIGKRNLLLNKLIVKNSNSKIIDSYKKLKSPKKSKMQKIKKYRKLKSVYQLK
jgi:hypothetical protein